MIILKDHDVMYFSTRSRHGKKDCSISAKIAFAVLNWHLNTRCAAPLTQ